MTLIRVGFNAYLLASPGLRGWTRYTVNLLAALPTHGIRPVLYSIAPINTDHVARLPADSFEMRVAPRMRYLQWENCWLPRQLHTDRIDVFHCPMNYGMPWSTPCPRVLTLHDAIDQIYYGRRLSWRDWCRPSAVRSRLTNRAARVRAHHIITVSEHAKGDIVNYLHMSANRVSVIYEAADARFHQPVDSQAVATIREKYRLRQPYFLYLGGWEGRKNLPFLLGAFAAAKIDGNELVLAGGKDEQRAVLGDLAVKLGCADRVRFIGFMPDEELPALYAGALAFVYPSEYEGFGLQVCEAMAVGCPVLVTRATSLPEIAGDGGETFALDDPNELTSLLRRLASDDLFRADLAVRAIARSAFFSWERTAELTAAVYRRLVSPRQVVRG